MRVGKARGALDTGGGLPSYGLDHADEATCIMSDNQPLSPIHREVLTIKLEAARRMGAALRRVDVSEADTWPAVVEGALGAGITEGELAERLCISFGTLGRWQSGHSAPMANTRANAREVMAGMVDALAGGIEARLAPDAPGEEESPGPSL